MNKNKMMKTILSFALALVMAVSMIPAAFAARSNPITDALQVETGGWEINTGACALNKNPEARKAFKKAVRKLDGAEYRPIALLGTQVVAGTNYCILARCTTVTLEPEKSYVLVYVYEDLKGKCTVTEVKDIDADGMTDEGLDGGWEMPKSVSMKKHQDVKKTFKQATKYRLDGKYTAVSFLSSQVVSGTNYCVLAKKTSRISDRTEYNLVYVYETLNGFSYVTDAVEIEI